MTAGGPQVETVSTTLVDLPLHFALLRHIAERHDDAPYLSLAVDLGGGHVLDG